MKPEIWTVTICRNEDVWLRATLDAWAPFATGMLIQDTGSIDGTINEMRAFKEASRPTLDVRLSFGALPVGEALVSRHEMIAEIPRREDVWIVVLDADEIHPPSQIELSLKAMQDPEVDYVGTRQVPIGWDGRSCFDYRCLEPPLEEDRARYTTMYWAPKFTTRLFRSTRLDGVCNPKWGGETLYVKFDESRHTLTDDFKPQPVPEGCINTMFSGRTNWTDIYFWHATNLTRSTKWREIPQDPRTNSMNRSRGRMRAPYPLPAGVDVPEPMMRILAGLERV